MKVRKVCLGTASGTNNCKYPKHQINATMLVTSAKPTRVSELTQTIPLVPPLAVFGTGNSVYTLALPLALKVCVPPVWFVMHTDDKISAWAPWLHQRFITLKQSVLKPASWAERGILTGMCFLQSFRFFSNYIHGWQTPIQIACSWGHPVCITATEAPKKGWARQGCTMCTSEWSYRLVRRHKLSSGGCPYNTQYEMFPVQDSYRFSMI